MERQYIVGIELPEQFFTLVRLNSALVPEKSVGSKCIRDWKSDEIVHDIPIHSSNPFTFYLICVDKLAVLNWLLNPGIGEKGVALDGGDLNHCRK